VRWIIHGERTIYRSDWVGLGPSDPSESERIEWLPLPKLRQLLVQGEITDGLSLTALTHWFMTNG
jgi:hypothetical protein